MAIMRGELDIATERNALDKTQIADLQSELEAVYEVRFYLSRLFDSAQYDHLQAFNVELDGMFDDANLPPDEAFAALRRDLQSTKAQRNDIRLENM